MAPGAIFHVLRLAFVSLLRQRTADCSHQKGCGAQRPHRYLSPNRAHVRGISGAKICNCRQICSQSLIQIKKPASAMRLMVFMNTKKQQQVDPSASPYLVEAIEVADRKIKDYLLRHHLSPWHPISTAPNNHDLELKCWTVLRRSYFHFLAGGRMPASGSMPIWRELSTFSHEVASVAKSKSA